MQFSQSKKISVKPPASLAYGMIFTFIFLPILAIYLLNLDYPERFDAVGWIESYERHIKIFTPSEGVVAEIYASEGDIVSIGDKLLKIVQSEEDDFVAESLIQTTKYEISQILEQSRAETQKNSYEIKSLNLSISKARMDVKNNSAQEQAHLEKYTLIKDKLETALALAKDGYLSSKDIEAIQLERINAEIEMIEIRSRGEALVNDIESNELMISTKEVELQSSLSILHVSLTNKQAELSKLEERHGAVIRAPSNGVIDYIHTFEGQRLSVAAPASERLLLAIAPTDDRIKIKLLIPAELAGRLNTGAVVDLNIRSVIYNDAYPIKGHIDAISKTAFDAGEISAFPVADSTPVVVATVIPLFDQGDAFKGSISLNQGVEISSSITIDHKKVYARLIAALFGGESQ
ncbi:MAG: HlyD family secretion protein [Azoarcus sp.]|jgi:multidrug efflux pump subunit AcrA (membrane-fusion protein)|nr:HlyD family secretion protein [Azoarcus sp.]